MSNQSQVNLDLPLRRPEVRTPGWGNCCECWICLWVAS